MLINITAAFVLDLILGDPVFRYHPVRLIGSMLLFYKKFFYRLRYKLLGGTFFVISALLSVFISTQILEYAKRFLYLPSSINLLVIGMAFFLFCNRDMAKEARSIYRCLEEQDLEKARARVGRIVGRDTKQLDEKGVIRAAVESVAENIVDGFTGPLFYLALGGIPLAYIYKTVNTIDSLFGYRNEKYEKFGKAGARLDDFLNYVPARLNVLILFCASGFKKNVLSTIRVYGGKHSSPNAGMSEAGFSGYLGLALGGPSLYGGDLKTKQWIGENRLGEKELEDPSLILKAVSFYWKTVAVELIIFLAALYFLKLPLVFS
ncbi:MAG TPA: cobalamin biosynthesis protein CobD [Spirochaetes bacterium]|nr:cobalamin biosynthesis protein CobD [Spirochaetota bacterium]